jgi:cation/acetate symporter
MLFLAMGAAALPHLIARAAAAPSGRQAAASIAWTVLHLAVLVLAGLVLSHLLAAAGGAVSFLGGGEMIPLVTLFAALPAVLASLMLAAALAALFSLGHASLLAATTALSHDLWDESLDMGGPQGRRMIVARFLLIIVGAMAAFLAAHWSAAPGDLMEWALAFAAAGGFIPLVLGVWWKRCNEIGAIGGAVAGFGCTALAFILEQGIVPGGAEISALADIGAAHAGLLGAAIAFTVAVAVSLVTPAPEGDLSSLFATLRGDQGGIGMRERAA